READRNGAYDIIAIALKERMVFQANHNIQVAGRAAVGTRAAAPGPAKFLPGVHARRHRDFQNLFDLADALAVAILAGFGDIFAAAAAARARAHHREEAVLHANLPAPRTRRAGLRLGARGGTARLAGLAVDKRRDLELARHALGRLDIADLDLHLEIIATHTARPAPAATAEHAAEDVENIA